MRVVGRETDVIKLKTDISSDPISLPKYKKIVRGLGFPDFDGERLQPTRNKLDLSDMGLFYLVYSTAQKYC